MGAPGCPSEWAKVPLLLVSGEIGLWPTLAGDAVDVLDVNWRADQLLEKSYALLSRRGHLWLLLAKADGTAELLVRDDSCEWVKCRVGVVGMITIERRMEPKELSLSVAGKVARAHATLDALPNSRFSEDDVWNLLLLLSVPWTEEEAKGEEAVFSVLSDLEGDLSGSRKLVLWRGRSPLEDLGRFGGTTHLWVPSTADPLREALEAVATDKTEREALEILFKKRILESDLDELIAVLSRSTKQ
jgi:hypothetical protein